MKKSIWIGYDPRESDAYRVARISILMQASESIPIAPVELTKLHHGGLYFREHEYRVNPKTNQRQLWDIVSDAPMSTEFAISRFLTPHLAHSGWALFMDCDFMAQGDIADLFALADPRYAVMVVKHDQQPAESYKMDGQIQTAYPRKNWSSLMLFNCDHPANRRLSVSMINVARGRDLHQFCWLDDELIGELPGCWNHLVGVNPPNPAARLIHFTLGIPSMEGYAGCEYSQEWSLWRSLGV